MLRRRSLQIGGVGGFLVLGAGHFVVDIYSSGYAPLLPPMRDALGLSLAQVGWLTAAMVLSSSFLQPLYGVASDRMQSRWILVTAPLFTGLGFGMIAWASGFVAAAACFVLAGVGVAAYHPQGAAQAIGLLRGRPGLSLSIFITIGSAGFALGPILVAAAVQRWGLDGLWRLALPGIATAFLLALLLRGPERTSEPEPLEGLSRALRQRWRPLLLLYLLVVIRGTVQLEISAFLPLYLIERGYDLVEASFALTLFLGAGIVGALAGGWLHDRVGGRRVILISMAGSLPLLVGSFFLPIHWQLAALTAGIGVMLMNVSVNVVLAQQWVPRHRSTVSSLMMGFAWGVGGLLAPVVGGLADGVGLRTALLVVAVVPALGIPLALALPATPAPRGSSTCDEC